MAVRRRTYRFRFLDASVARIYEFAMMSSTQGPKSAPSLGYGGDELDGQYRIPDGEQCMKLTEVATDGGLLPCPITRDSFELWPAKRREVVVDFTRYMDGTPTTPGDVVYLTNVMKMPDGRMWSSSSRFSPDPRYRVPVLKFVIGETAPDDSQIPTVLCGTARTSREQTRPTPTPPREDLVALDPSERWSSTEASATSSARTSSAPAHPSRPGCGRRP